MKFRFASVLAAALVALLAVSGCSVDESQFGDLVDEPTTSSYVTVPLETMTLAYNSAYPLDPFGDTTELNLQVAKLCYEPLFALDKELDTYGLLASGVTKVSDTEYTITLNVNRTFWDGSGVTAADVVFSYNKAVEGGHYGYLAGLVASITASDAQHLSVVLTRADAFFANVMTFPVIRESTYKKADNGDPGYIGTGVYKPVYDDGIVLELNSANPRAATANVKSITLKNTADFQAMNDSVNAGILNACFDDISGGKLPEVSGNVFGIQQDRLLYIGFNRAGVCENTDLRKAISMSLDRSRLTGYFGGYCDLATSLFHPAYGAAECNTLIYDQTEADALLAEIGAIPQLTFAVCESNEIKVNLAEELARQLNSAGIPVTLKKLSYSEYLGVIAAGNFDIYLGEAVLSDDFSFDCLIKSGGSYGITCSDELIAARDAFLATSNSDAFVEAYDGELPFAALAYRRGMVAYSSNLVITESDSFNFAFCNIERTEAVVRAENS